MSFWLMVFIIFAGQALGTLLGLVGQPSDKLMRNSLAFAASMMIGISFFNLVPEALAVMEWYWVIISFFMGIGILKLADIFIPHVHPEIPDGVGDMKRCVTMLSIGMALHNIPEGLAVGIGFARDRAIGLAVAIGMAIQDVPENIAAVIPINCFVKNKAKSFLIILITILFQLFGFLVGYFVLKGAGMMALGTSLAMAAGFMYHISVAELLPKAELKKYPRESALSLLGGALTVIVVTYMSRFI